MRLSLNFVTELCYTIFTSVDLILDGKLYILFIGKTYEKTYYHSQNTISPNIGLQYQFKNQYYCSLLIVKN